MRRINCCSRIKKGWPFAGFVPQPGAEFAFLFSFGAELVKRCFNPGKTKEFLISFWLGYGIKFIAADSWIFTTKFYIILYQEIFAGF